MIDRWRPPRKDERELAWVAFGVAAAGIALSPLAAFVAGLFPPCLFRQWVGVPCPTCGATRAILALGRLDVAAAVAVNPLACAIVVSLTAAGLAALISVPAFIVLGYVFGHSFDKLKARVAEIEHVIVFVLIGIAIVWVLWLAYSRSARLKETEKLLED